MFYVTAVQTLLGLIFVFTGSNLYRSSPPLGGFIIGGLIAVNVEQWLYVPPAGMEVWALLGSFVIGGLIGALISIPLHAVAYVLTGIALGAVVGVVVGFVVNQQGITRLLAEGVLEIATITPLQGILMITFGMLFGLASVRFEETMVMVSTAFLGSLIAASGLSTLGGGQFPLLHNNIFLAFFWFTLGAAGWIWQNYHKDY